MPTWLTTRGYLRMLQNQSVVNFCAVPSRRSGCTSGNVCDVSGFCCFLLVSIVLVLSPRLAHPPPSFGSAHPFLIPLVRPRRRFYALGHAAPSDTPFPPRTSHSPPPFLAALSSLPHPVYPRPLTVFPSLICTRSTAYTSVLRPRSLFPRRAPRPPLPLRTLLAHLYPRSLYSPGPASPTSLPSLAPRHFPLLRPHRPHPFLPPARSSSSLHVPVPSCCVPGIPCTPSTSTRASSLFYFPLLPALPSPCALLLPFPSRAPLPCSSPRAPSLILPSRAMGWCEHYSPLLRPHHALRLLRLRHLASHRPRRRARQEVVYRAAA
ncbi:hypothetical protein DFH09DRAFT_598684 [Mycena vulgaris]|nr:hypothetical protein DFH09DRAFT_598684 [Mycena vulgaris]